MVVAILGMHRSGTSCLTGLLEEAGLYLGEVSRKNPHNIKGNHENPKIVALHEQVLASNQARWDRPPPWGCLWLPEQLLELKQIVDEHRKHDPCGFKDPRTLLTLEGWLETVPDLRLVATFRHPEAVARSLSARDRGELVEDYLRLWEHYNLRLLHFHDQFHFDLVCFDDPPQIYLENVTQAAYHLGLTPRRFSFFEETLRHQRVESTLLLPTSIEELYLELKNRALKP